ncbi:hypothetical protein PIB30_031726 [Stylosanthes scabra]|uniref:Uncharacterized protein n=1 Tax=Stylosanthes scabra TaxID=79078 RepID=A0ABU6TCR0_9FABA|nr:hypothetical protein [Stylosanthes scabra]
MLVLQENIGTNEIELIFLEAPMSKVIDWDGEAFRKMGNLKALIIKSGNFFNGPNHLPNSLRVLEWRGYPSHSLPADFHPRKLCILKLPHNCFTPLPLVKLLKEFVDMTVLDFSWNDWITDIPDVSSAPNLKEFHIACCYNLVKIDESVGFLSKLSVLEVQDKLFGIFLSGFPNLNQLSLSFCNITILPSCIKNCHLLRFLRLTGCKNLQEIKGIPPNIIRLEAIRCTSLSCSSKGILLNKEVHESVGKKRFILPGKSIPSWFENQSSGQPISFWFRNKFPAMSLCFLFKESTYCMDNIVPQLKLVSNDWHIFHDKIYKNHDGHIWIYDLEDNPDQVFQHNEWNQAVLSLSKGNIEKQVSLSPEEWGSIAIGVHIIKERSNMDDIKFSDPLLDNHHVHDLGLSLPPPPPLSDNFKWDRGQIVIRVYGPPKTSIIQYLGSELLSNTPSAGKAKEEEEDDDNDEMDAFYDSLDGATIPMLSNSHEKLVTTTPSDEEIRQALRSVQRFLSHDASVLLDPELCSILKANLDCLSKLSADHGGISREMSKVISEASQFLIHWSRDYTNAHTKVDYIMSQLERADELEMSLESNKKRYLEVVASRKRKREIFEEGKTIKAELDELRKNVSQWEHEHTLAKKTQATLIVEWSRLRETFFQNIEKDRNLEELE